MKLRTLLVFFLLVLIVIILFEFIFNNKPVIPSTGGIPVPTSTTMPTLPVINTVDLTLAQYLPNPQLTPGDVLNVTTKEICVPGYAQKVRNVPEAVKQEVYQQYGIPAHTPGSYEVDHLISLELGGSNSIKNLWPESYSGVWNAHNKDRLEDSLHKLVCDGKMDLQTAQHDISNDWIAAYQQILGRP